LNHEGAKNTKKIFEPPRRKGREGEIKMNAFSAFCRFFRHRFSTDDGTKSMFEPQKHEECKEKYGSITSGSNPLAT
jgi:hypothetical protein